MGFMLLPVIVLSFLLGIVAIERNHANEILPTSAVTQSTQDGQTFVSYRNAVAVYQQNNPSFTGTVSNTQLLTQGSQFSPTFLASAGNAITATGISGRIITCYAALTPSALAAASNATDNDASLGIASGTSWTSTAQGATPITLATTVPNGAIVSVVQIGN